MQKILFASFFFFFALGPIHLLDDAQTQILGPVMHTLGIYNTTKKICLGNMKMIRCILVGQLGSQGKKEKVVLSAELTLRYSNVGNTLIDALIHFTCSYTNWNDWMVYLSNIVGLVGHMETNPKDR